MSIDRNGYSERTSFVLSKTELLAQAGQVQTASDGSIAFMKVPV